MDRKYKAEDTVHVYRSERYGALLATFVQAPYIHAGFDNYRYKGVMYKGFSVEGHVYILLDQPLKAQP